MKTLKKLSEEHYIIYDDSIDIEENCFCFKNEEIIEVSFLMQDNGSRITHSFGKELDGVENRPLYEVEELLFGYNVYKLAEKEIPSSHSIYSMTETRRSEYVKGFRKAMELNKEKLFTIEDMLVMYHTGRCNQGREEDTTFEQKLKILQPTEWKVKFNEQGKLELL